MCNGIQARIAQLVVYRLGTGEVPGRSQQGREFFYENRYGICSADLVKSSQIGLTNAAFTHFLNAIFPFLPLNSDEPFLKRITLNVVQSLYFRIKTWNTEVIKPE